MSASVITPKVVWEPLPGSQTLALDSRADETLFCGSRGPGKTEVQLMRFRRHVGQGYGNFWTGIIFDREYKNLGDIILKSKRAFYKFGDGAEFRESTSHLKWVWKTGEELLLRAIDDPDDYSKYHGQEFPFIGWNELTSYPTDECYEAMMSCNRSSFTEKDWPVNSKGKPVPLPPIPIQVFSTTNSLGVGREWVKKKFIDPAPYGTIVKTNTKIIDPITQEEEEVTRTQVAIFGSWKENKYLPKKYIAGLHKIKDENKRKSWLEGDWNVTVGGAFDDLWMEQKHVLPRFKIPSTWYVNRTFDWGSTAPFSVGFWAEANGEEATIIWKKKEYSFCPPKGTIIRIAEWYGCDREEINTGLKLSAKKIAEGIKEIEARLIEDGWITGKVHPGPADNQIRNVTEEDVETIEKKMKDCGIIWMHSDKSPGSRKNGFDLFRARLEASIDKELEKEPRFYITSNCTDFKAHVPSLVRDDKVRDDVDTEQEDHIWDETRYRILQGNNRLATEVNFSFPTCT